MRFRTFSLLAGAPFLFTAAWAAGPDVCAALPLAKVNAIVHQNLSGTRSTRSLRAGN